MRVSHSRVEVFDRCPYKYRLRYVEGIDTIPNTDADNALILGTALHTGIEEGVEQALDFYKNSFPVLTDDHIHEMMKLEAMIPKAKAMLPALFKKMNAGDFAPPMYCSTINEIAIKIPPPITNGSI